MYAAAGGASLASRQARRNVKKQHVISSDAVHQQFQRRFQQLHQEHARLYTDINGKIPVPGDHEGKPSAAAWTERERRVSVADCSVAHHQHRVKVSDSHRKWTRRNRVHDASFGGSSSDEDEPTSALYGHQNGAANALLYVGLGTVAIGLVIAFVGTGEKGFKTVELRLIGPTLIGSGFLCCLIRVFLCVCPSNCLRRYLRKRGPTDHEYYQHLPYHTRTAEDFIPSSRPPVNRDKKRVSIIPTPSTSSKKFIEEPVKCPVAAMPKVPLPNLVESPSRDDPHSIEMQRMEGSNSFDDLPSISSEDSFNELESLALVQSSKTTCAIRDTTSAEQMARLKSTLTFQDEEPTNCPRIEEEDSEIIESPVVSPILVPPQPSSSTEWRELVLSPDKLQNL